jgi:hypothetical protein
MGGATCLLVSANIDWFCFGMCDLVVLVVIASAAGWVTFIRRFKLMAKAVAVTHTSGNCQHLGVATKQMNGRNKQIMQRI